MSAEILVPTSTVAQVIAAYPALEASIVAAVPALGVLQTPALKQAVYAGTTLAQLAGRIDMSEAGFANMLRTAAGIADLLEETVPAALDMTPHWISQYRLAEELDARPLLARGEHPAARVMASAEQLGEKECMKLITPFTPSPLVSMAENAGLKTYVEEKGPGEIWTWFAK